MPQQPYLVGLIGAGIGPSLTPPMHMAEAKALGLDYVYRTIDIAALGIAPTEVGTLVRHARTLGYDALNITHPCKQLVVEHLDALDERAARLGAVNTVLFTERGSVGYNTDTSGFATAFRTGSARCGHRRRRPARCRRRGHRRRRRAALPRHRAPDVVDVDADRGGALARALADRFPTPGSTPASPTSSPCCCRTADGLVHCTPIGMADHPGLPVRSRAAAHRAVGRRHRLPPARHRAPAGRPRGRLPDPERRPHGGPPGRRHLRPGHRDHPGHRPHVRQLHSPARRRSPLRAASIRSSQRPDPLSDPKEGRCRPPSPAPSTVTKTPRKAALASFMGSAVEYYDFFLFGAAAALIFPHVFFPDADASALVMSFATFGIAYVARPIGAIILGHFGDRIGRQKVLMFTLVLMGVSTFAIGLLPTFDQIWMYLPGATARNVNLPC